MFTLRDDTREPDTEFWLEANAFGGIDLKARRGDFSQYLLRLYPYGANLPNLSEGAAEKLGIATEFNMLKINNFEDVFAAARAVVNCYDWASSDVIQNLGKALNEM